MTDKHPLLHIARFILIGYYTGARAVAIATVSPDRAEGRSYVDLEAGVFHRLADGKKANKTRQSPVRLPARLLAQIRRWQIKTHVIEWNGKQVKSVKTGFRTAVKEAGLERKVRPHTLRHTSATWMMQQGVDVAEIADYPGITVKMLNDMSGHHPNFQHGVGDSFSVQHHQTRQKVRISVGASTKIRAPKTKTSRIGGIGDRFGRTEFAIRSL